MKIKAEKVLKNDPPTSPEIPEKFDENKLKAIAEEMENRKKKWLKEYKT